MTGSRPLDIYDLAYLAGGPDRTVDTAIVTLVRSGRIRVHSPGQLATADLFRRHPVEAAVLDAVGPRGHRSVDTISWRLIEDDRLLGIGRRLQEAGLLGRLSAVVPGRRRGRRGLAPTRAGQRLLRELADQPPGADPEAVRVALGGRDAMTDAPLRTAIFERPETVIGPPGSRRRRRDIDHSDPQLAALRNRAVGTAGAAIAIDAGFDGGGF